MQNSFILFMFFTLFLQLFLMKKSCKTKKASSEYCLLNVVFQEHSSSYELYFLFLKRWSYLSPHKFSLQMVQFPREKRKKFSTEFEEN